MGDVVETGKAVVALLQSVPGRDKFYRIAAYYSKYVLWRVATGRSAMDSEDAARLKHFASSVGTARKMLRFGRSFENGMNVLTLFDERDDFLRIAGIVKNVALFGWLANDSLEWLHAVRVRRLADPAATKRLGAKFWLVGLFAGFLIAMVQLRRNLQAAEDAKRRRATAHGLSSDEEVGRTRALELSRNKILRAAVKSGVDMIIPLSRLGLPASDGLIGLIGTFTGLIGLYEEWGKAVKTAKKK